MKKKAILITGSANRIGFELVKYSVNNGYSIIAHYNSNTGEIGKWLNKYPKFNSDVHLVQTDFLESPELLMGKALSYNINIVGLVNNASNFTKGNLTKQKHFNKILQINTIAPLQLAQDFAKTKNAEWIINLTDSHIKPINDTYQNYRISKLFLSEITRQLAFQLAPRIRVNAIAPGAIIPSPTENKKEFSDLKTTIPLRKTGSIKSILNAYNYLINETYTTGQTMYVDGGWHIL